MPGTLVPACDFTTPGRPFRAPRQFRRMLADQANESCIVMQDIEGNEFCLD